MSSSSQFVRSTSVARCPPPPFRSRPLYPTFQARTHSATQKQRVRRRRRPSKESCPRCEREGENYCVALLFSVARPFFVRTSLVFKSSPSPNPIDRPSSQKNGTELRSLPLPFFKQTKRCVWQIIRVRYSTTSRVCWHG